LKTPHSEISDERLLEMIQNPGHWENGFRLLMEKYQERLYWQARRMVQNHDDANDVIQNTFIKVYKNIGGFEGKSKLITWLIKIVTNESITFLNKKKRNQSTPLDNGERSLTNNLESDPYFEGSEVQRRLQEAIATLPEKQKLVFNLRYFDEMSYADMSEIVGTSEGALKASFHHAVKKIESFITRVTIS
jgi:RNA polymerase sigma-70 factor, ECF subfamily